jgi:uncharacterized damage-inducible protein DinB
MPTFPQTDEASQYYFRYIDRVQTDDILGLLDTQLDGMLPTLQGISEEKSLHRYGPEKWSIRQVINHVNDTERVFLFRAYWFARGFGLPLPGMDQDVAAAAARADGFSWASHLEELQAVRQATLTFFHNLPADAWMRGGIASDNPFTVNALAYILAGHASHHMAVLQERYL